MLLKVLLKLDSQSYVEPQMQSIVFNFEPLASFNQPILRIML